MTKNASLHVFDCEPIPAIAGIGLKPEHFENIFEDKPKPLWFEVHTENYMSDGGPSHQYLEAIRKDYALSFHGVSLSIGSAGPLNKNILKRTKKLIDRYQPGLISEHLSWSAHDNTYFNDLLPLPYTEETLTLVIDHVDETQNFLGRQISIENPSTYLQFIDSKIPEYEFLTQVAKITGCGLLIDVNNLYVNVRNHGINATEWLVNIPAEFVQEIHLAGHHVNVIEDQEILIDDHGSNVCEDVWELYEFALKVFGPKPSLIEWDTRIPSLDVLRLEASIANRYLTTHKVKEAINA
ncbi:MAG: DUF692 domain-containing protein [Emcibacteraceae bacterium]|nr:DUF692 domain-containing protein [Emcibacteraceae bacterium]